MEPVVIIDDEADLCKTLEKILEKAGYRPFWTTDPHVAVDLVVRESPACVLLDLKIGEVDGLQLLREIHEKVPRTPVIMLTAYETVKTAVAAMKEGAFYYLAKPFDNDELLGLVNKAVEGWRLGRQIEDLKSRLGGVDDIEASMGTSEKIQEVIRLARLVAATDVNVLLLGETGSGKELVARSIHQFSNRKEKPFVAVDCASIPETLIESELFGHEKGAFTGATSLQKGHIEEANGGTLFLDEVGNIPISIQPKLLRFLESHEFHRVGGRRPIEACVRVVAATNVDLGEETKSKGFRLDLLYRLNEFPIHLPPLRQRRVDIPLLAHTFLKQFSKETGSRVTGITPQALERLQEYPFPGNCRELRNVIKRAMVLAKGEIDIGDLPVEVRNRGQGTFSHEVRVPVSYGLPLKEVSRQAVLQIEKQLISDALRRAEGHQGRAAVILGVDAKTLYNKMKEYGIQA